MQAASNPDRVTRFARDFLSHTPIDLKNPYVLKEVFRMPAMIARESAAMMARDAREAEKKGAPAPSAPSDALLRLLDEEHKGILLIFGLLRGDFGEKVAPGWAGKPVADWLAKAIPGDLYGETPDFAKGTVDAALQNFVMIFSNVYSKFAAYEQLLKKFEEPVNESDFDGMVDVFARLAAGASDSVKLPEAFNHMDFSGEPVPDTAEKKAE